MGVDYLLRASLRVTSLNQTAASKGVRALARSQSLPGLIAVERETVQRIRALRPSHRDLDRQEWQELCTMCLILAWFEQFYRTGPGMSWEQLERLLPPLLGCDKVDELIPHALTEPSIRDLEQLGRAAWEDHRGFRHARLRLNPEFALSPALGGADADLIVDGTLIDWKTTITRCVVGRKQLWQLLGYALADTDDQYGIREVGIAALRWRSQITWHLPELIAQLASAKAAQYKKVDGQIIEIEPADLDTLRAEFATVAKRLRHSHRLGRTMTN
jgi:hypothetical protein